jgi:non-ribosomal peptide synthetase component E (peptide arylation enzyme)
MHGCGGTRRPGFLDAVCFAAPCPIMGDRVHAAVVAKPAQSISREALCAFLARQGVAPYKYPERLVVVQSRAMQADASCGRNSPNQPHPSRRTFGPPQGEGLTSC